MERPAICLEEDEPIAAVIAKLYTRVTLITAEPSLDARQSFSLHFPHSPPNRIPLW